MKQLLNLLKKVMINGGLFIIIGIFTYRTIFKNTNFQKTVALVSNGNYKFLIIGITMICLILCLEAINIKRNLKLLNENESFLSCLVYTFTGNFFSGITPAATGGQPMEIFMMHKRGVSLVNATLSLIMDLAMYQIAVTTIGILAYLRYANTIHGLLGHYIWLLWLGIVLNLILLLGLLFAMFSKNFVYYFVEIITKIIMIFSKAKANNFKLNSISAIKQYKTSSNLFLKHKAYCLINLTIAFVRVILMHSAPFWVYRVLGLNDVSIIEIIGFQSMLYISCAVLPFPGGIGIAESNFARFFKMIFPEELLQVSMILSRGIGSYITIAISGSIFVATIITNFIIKRSKCLKNTY